MFQPIYIDATNLNKHRTDKLWITLKRILFHLLLIYTCLDANAQALINNLDYTDLSKWNFFSAPFHVERNDTTENRDVFHVFFSKRYLLDMASKWKDKNKPETFDICSSFVIPKDSVHFSFYCNSLKVDSLLLKVNLYRDNEIFLDQLVYPLNMNGPNLISFRNTDAAVMDVHIHGKSMMQYDSIALKITDFNISTVNNDLDRAVCGYQSLISNMDVTPLFEINKLDEFKTRKIIGLGESIHGSRSIIQKKKEITEKLCEDKDIKLICFEVGMDMVMNWDLYIQGVLPENYLKKIEDDVTVSFGEPEITIELLSKLRVINKERRIEDRIHVVGLDLRINDFYVFEYFKAYKNLRKQEDFLNDIFFKMDTLIYSQLGPRYVNIVKGIVDSGWKIISESRRYTSLIPIMEGDRQLRTLMEGNDYRYLTKGLLLNIPTKRDASVCDSIMDRRDDYMWQILQLAISCYAPQEKDRIVIHSHSIHLSRTYNPNSLTKVFARKNLGAYIANHYEKDYLSISFHVGNGKYKTFDSKERKMDEGVLQIPPVGSFEWAVGQVCFNDFYCRQSDFDAVTSFRSIGNTAIRNSQFFPFSKHRFDSYIYIDNSIACSPLEWRQQAMYGRQSGKRAYIDSLKVVNTPYTPFNYHIFFLDSTINSRIATPEGFYWKKKTFHTIFGDNLDNKALIIGFFESEEGECIIVINNNLSPNSARSFRRKSNQASSYHEKILIANQSRGIMALAEDLFIKSFSLKSSQDNDEAYQKDKYTLMNRYLTFRDESYAKEIFNADKVIEIPLRITSADDVNLKPIGSFRHGEAILIGKKDATIHLNVFYTDKGYRQKEKYRKAIESLITFE